jgi:hypothetical protein
MNYKNEIAHKKKSGKGFGGLKNGRMIILGNKIGIEGAVNFS